MPGKPPTSPRREQKRRRPARVSRPRSHFPGAWHVLDALARHIGHRGGDGGLRPPGLIVDHRVGLQVIGKGSACTYVDFGAHRLGMPAARLSSAGSPASGLDHHLGHNIGSDLVLLGAQAASQPSGDGGRRSGQWSRLAAAGHWSRATARTTPDGSGRRDWQSGRATGRRPRPSPSTACGKCRPYLACSCFCPLLLPKS